ncbi:MAG TPA: hypothetical protein VFZ48_04940 [Candidatus Saccharimonadales bacterium]
MSRLLKQLTGGPRLFYVLHANGMLDQYLLVKDGYAHWIAAPSGSWKPTFASRMNDLQPAIKNGVAQLGSIIIGPQNSDSHRWHDGRPLFEVDASALGKLTWEAPTRANQSVFGRYNFTGAPPAVETGR